MMKVYFSSLVIFSTPQGSLLDCLLLFLLQLYCWNLPECFRFFIFGGVRGKWILLLSNSILKFVSNFWVGPTYSQTLWNICEKSSFCMTFGCELETWLWGTKCSSDVQLGGWISSHQWGDCLQLYSIIQQLQKTTEDAWPSRFFPTGSLYIMVSLNLQHVSMIMNFFEAFHWCSLAVWSLQIWWILFVLSLRDKCFLTSSNHIIHWNLRSSISMKQLCTSIM